MSLLDTASLIVTPNGYKEGKLYSVIPSDGSGDLSVTRATTATRVNSQGLVELVPYNLNSYSENFTLSWGTDGTSTATNNFTTAPNGTQTAAKVVANFVNGYAYKSLPVAVGTYTLSFYVKASAPTTISVDFNDIGAGVFGQVFNLTTEWQRVSFTHNVTVGSNLYISYSGLQLGVEYYIWGAQLVEGSVAKDYQKTETRLNIPRLDYSNGTCPSILVEPQRTNLLTYSSSFDNAAWTKNASTITANTTTSPSGIQDADTITETTYTNDSASILVFASSTSNIAYTSSIYVKKSSGNFFYLRNFYGISNEYYTIVVDLQLGIITKTQAGSGVSNVSSTITNVGNDWYRITATQTSASTTFIPIYGISDSGTPTIGTFGQINNASNNNRSAYIWGAQAELGSYATSYIPTTSASVTRNADVISKTGISSLIGQTEGTLFYDGYFGNGLDEVYMFIQKNGSTGVDDSIYIQRESSGSKIFFNVWLGGTQQSIIGGGNFAVGDRIKIACAYKTNDFVIYINGTQISFDTTGTPPTCDNIHLCTYGGAPTTAIYMAQGGTNASALWKTRLTNTQLAQLTTI